MRAGIYKYIAVLAMLAASAAAVPAETTPAAPRVQIEQASHEFEPVVEGSQVAHAFTVRNVGSAPLIIEKVRTG